MQNQKTQKINFDELPDISTENQIFARAIANGKNGSDAYRLSRDCRDLKNESIWAMASRLRSDPKVRSWISAYKLAGMDDAILDKQQYIRMMLSAAEEARLDGNHGARIAALKEAGLASGVTADRVEMITDPNQALLELAKISPEFAKAAALEAGMVWDNAKLN